ncbi:hypothetical protein NN561_012885 [Cricetulus griseus]
MRGKQTSSCGAQTGRQVALCRKSRAGGRGLYGARSCECLCGALARGTAYPESLRWSTATLPCRSLLRRTETPGFSGWLWADPVTLRVRLPPRQRLQPERAGPGAACPGSRQLGDRGGRIVRRRSTCATKT